MPRRKAKRAEPRDSTRSTQAKSRTVTRRKQRAAKRENYR
jgi:hypothetical protein